MLLPNKNAELYIQETNIRKRKKGEGERKIEK